MMPLRAAGLWCPVASIRQSREAASRAVAKNKKKNIFFLGGGGELCSPEQFIIRYTSPPSLISFIWSSRRDEWMPLYPHDAYNHYSRCLFVPRVTRRILFSFILAVATSHKGSTTTRLVNTYLSWHQATSYLSPRISVCSPHGSILSSDER